MILLTLLLTRNTRKKISTLAQIIESHWQLQATIIDLEQYETNQISNYDALFLIEEYNRRIPYHLLIDIIQTDKKIIWSGYGNQELVPSI